MTDKTDKIEWKFKEDIDPIAATDNFWYLLVDGGYIHPEHLLADNEQLEKVIEAQAILQSFETALWANDILEEY
jgi:hypothetical protein